MAIAPDPTAQVGWAFDGYPVYASEDSDGVPTGLDAYSGHTGPTADLPDEGYPYNASETAAPNMPTSLAGASSRRPSMTR